MGGGAIEGVTILPLLNKRLRLASSAMPVLLLVSASSAITTGFLAAISTGIDEAWIDDTEPANPCC